MNRFAPGVLGGAVLALGLCFLNPARGRDDRDEAVNNQDVADARKDILELADMADGPSAAFKARAATLAKKYDYPFIARQFMPRAKGGFGVGPTPNAIKPDGIELKILALARRPLGPAQLAAERTDLQRMAEVTQALAEVGGNFGTQVAGPGRVAAWNKIADDATRRSQEFRVAVAAGNGKEIQRAAVNLGNACCDCHTQIKDK